MFGLSKRIGVVNDKIFNGSLPSGITESFPTSLTVATNLEKARSYVGGSGSATGFAQNISTLDYFYSDQGENGVVFKPTVAGLGISIAMTSQGVGQFAFARFNTTTGILTVGLNTTDVSSATAITFPANSILMLKIAYNAVGRTFTATISDYQNWGTYRSVTTSAGAAGIGVVSNIIVAFHGGTNNVYRIRSKSGTWKDGKIGFIGDSNTQGEGLPYAQCWTGSIINGTQNTVDRIAWRGAKSVDFTSPSMLSYISKSAYEWYYIMIGTNDVNGGVSLASYLNNLNTIINTCLATGAKVRLLSILPNVASAATIPTWNAAIAALANGSTIFYVNVYTVMDNGSGAMNPAYTSDGTHINAPTGTNAFLSVVQPDVNVIIEE